MDKDKVLRLVKKIPEGKVTTYGRLAKAAKVKSPRTVGQILHKNSNPQEYPCHRVVMADGTAAEGYAFGGLKAQLEKLRKEGVSFNKKSDTVDFRKSLYVFTSKD